jgi:hypothetical protein
MALHVEEGEEGGLAAWTREGGVQWLARHVADGGGRCRSGDGSAALSHMEAGEGTWWVGVRYGGPTAGSVVLGRPNE